VARRTHEDLLDQLLEAVVESDRGLRGLGREVHVDAEDLAFTERLAPLTAVKHPMVLLEVRTDGVEAGGGS
jgi:hypothetical protein